MEKKDFCSNVVIWSYNISNGVLYINMGYNGKLENVPACKWEVDINVYSNDINEALACEYIELRNVPNCSYGPVYTSTLYEIQDDIAMIYEDILSERHKVWRFIKVSIN